MWGPQNINILLMLKVSVRERGEGRDGRIMGHA
jgi:hypothetical protein